MGTLNTGLTTKQLRWIDEYLVDFNGAASAVRAGYSPKTARAIACELLTKPHIQAVLQAKQGVLAEELRITRQGVIRGLLDAFEMSRDQQNPGAMVAALSTIGKMLGFYAVEVRKVELSAPQSGTYRDFASWSDAQLLEAIAAGGAVVSDPS